MADQARGANGSVFISYSRKDKAFVKKLNDALDSAGVRAVHSGHNELQFVLTLIY